jgi:hypothetical protein
MLFKHPDDGLLTAAWARAARLKKALVTSSTEKLLSRNLARSCLTVKFSVISRSFAVRTGFGSVVELMGSASGRPSSFGSTFARLASRAVLTLATLVFQISTAADILVKVQTQ